MRRYQVLSVRERLALSALPVYASAVGYAVGALTAGALAFLAFVYCAAESPVFDAWQAAGKPTYPPANGLLWFLLGTVAAASAVFLGWQAYGRFEEAS